MAVSKLFRCWSLVGLVACSLLASEALGQRGDRGGRGGGGGGDRGGGRSVSGGGGGDRGGGRSGGNRGGGQSRGGRSFSGGGRGELGGGRSFQGNRGGGGQSSLGTSRAMQGGNPRSAQREAVGRSRTSESSRPSARGSLDTGRTSGQPRAIQGTRGARSQVEGRQNYQARRPTDDQVQQFLRRGNQDTGSVQRSGQAARQSETFQRNREQARREVDQFRRDGQQLGQRDGDQVRGDSDQIRRDREQFRQRDLTGRGRDFDRRLEGQAGDRSGRDIRDRDFADRDSRDRDSRDRDFDREDGRSRYWRWRNDAWAGERGRGRDFRDWSGRWREGDRFDVASRVRNDWRGRDWNDFPFRSGWWGGRNWYGRNWYFWDSFARNRPFYWWAWATAPRLTNWFHYGWSTPYYWDYGPGEYIYYDDGAIYVNGRWHQPAPVYYTNTVRLIEQAPEWTAEEAAQQEWLPLGVFAVTREGTAEVDVLVQLAVTQDGVLAGSATDQRSGVVYSVEGTVDQQSQRAVWAYTDEQGQRTVMETSIFNLTQPEATGLVHNGPNEIEVIELVRLEAPERTTVAAEGELPAPPATR